MICMYMHVVIEEWKRITAVQWEEEKTIVEKEKLKERDMRIFAFQLEASEQFKGAFASASHRVCNSVNFLIQLSIDSLKIIDLMSEVKNMWFYIKAKLISVGNFVKVYYCVLGQVICT